MKSIIELPVRIHLINDTQNKFTTTRTENDIRAMFDEINRIWTPAQIRFKISTVQLETVGHEQIVQLLDRPCIEIPSDNSNFIDIYFLHNFQLISGINLGYTRRELRRVFIVDNLCDVNDYRCVAHEFGHVLRLDHVTQFDRLMEKRGNGETILDWEIRIARHMAIM